MYLANCWSRCRQWILEQKFADEVEVLAIERICKNYYGFGKDDIAYLKMIGKKSRWCCVKRSYPSVIMSEHEIKIV